MSQPQYDLRAEFEAAEAASVAAEQAHAQLAAAETEAQRERDRRHRKVWQDYADQYASYERGGNPIRDAKQELRRALAETDLGRALINYQHAIHRDAVLYKLAREAVAAGAELPAGMTVTGGGGAVWGPGNDASQFIGPVISQLVYEAAAERVETEQQAVRAAAKDARDSVDIPQPDWFRVVAPFTEDRTEDPGGVYTHFVADPAGAVAYLDPTSPVLRWYQQHADFDVQVVYGVPEQYRTAARRMARNPELYKAGTTGLPGPEADQSTNPVLRG